MTDNLTDDQTAMLKKLADWKGCYSMSIRKEKPALKALRDLGLVIYWNGWDAWSLTEEGEHAARNLP